MTKRKVQRIEFVYAEPTERKIGLKKAIFFLLLQLSLDALTVPSEGQWAPSTLRDLLAPSLSTMEVNKDHFLSSRHF